MYFIEKHRTLLLLLIFMCIDRNCSCRIHGRGSSSSSFVEIVIGSTYRYPPRTWSPRVITPNYCPCPAGSLRADYPATYGRTDLSSKLLGSARRGWHHTSLSDYS